MSDFIKVGLFLLVVVGAILYGSFRLICRVVESEQRECTAECLAAKARGSEKSCAFYCRWGRQSSNTDVVVMPVPQ